MLPVYAAHQHAAQAAAQGRARPAVGGLAEAEGDGQLHGMAGCAGLAERNSRCREGIEAGETAMHTVSKSIGQSAAAAQGRDIHSHSSLASVLK